MKRSKVIVLTMAGLGLGVTGCKRSSGPDGDAGILPLTSLNSDMRSRIPAYTPGANVSAENPPLNAFDENLGYFHQPCSAWFPYPYDYYDSRWGYYRCGKWSRHDSTRSRYPHTTRTFTGTTSSFADGNDSGPAVGTGKTAPTTGGADADYTTQPAGAPVHAGVAHREATVARTNSISRRGFGSTGRSSSSLSSSS